ncbi:hypothetical protein EC991_009784, partial [Linnemannia zychae]
MELTQSFRLIGSMDIEEIPCDRADGHYVTSWVDIEQVFPGVKQIKNGKVTVTMMKDPNRQRIIPHCIKHHPGVVLDVVLSSTADRTFVNSSMATPANGRAATSPTPPTNFPTNTSPNPLTNAPLNTSTNPLANFPANFPANIPSNLVTITPLISPATAPVIVPAIAPAIVPAIAPAIVPAIAPSIAPSVARTDSPTEAFSTISAVIPLANPSADASAVTPTHTPADTPTNTPADTSTNTPVDTATIDALTTSPATIPSVIPTAVASADTLTIPSGNVLIDHLPPADVAIDVTTSASTNDAINPAVDASTNPPTNNQTNNQQDASPHSAIADIVLANPPSSLSTKVSGTSSPIALTESVSSLAIAARASDDLSLAKQQQGFQSTVISQLSGLHDQGAKLHDQGAKTQQIAQEIFKLQKQMNDRLILVQSKTEAILNQQLELAEYPIPRLFIVLPEELTKYDPANWFRTKFRLHFICECGKHTEPSNSKVPHHLHLAKHEGYIIREPTKFFKKYGPFLLLMLELIKFGTSVTGHVVPLLASLKVIELADSVKQSVELVTAKIDYSLDCIDSQLGKIQASLPEGSVNTERREAMSQQDLANYLRDVEGLEGVELRQLGSFLMTSEGDNILGNLYRMTTSNGHVKWVCRDHYRVGYQEKHVQSLRDIVNIAQGKFDEQLGKITITLRSSFAATEFYNAIRKAKGVLELAVDLRWECTKSDLEELHDALKKSRVLMLRLDIGEFGTSLGRTSLRKFLPTSPYKPLYRIAELQSMKAIHIILPKDFVMISSFHPKRLPHLPELSFELVAGSFVAKELESLVEALRTNSTLTTLNLQFNKVGPHEVQAMAEVLRTNSTMITLDLGNNFIGGSGAQSLSAILQANSTLTTLILNDNSLGDEGAQALAEALKTNATLTTLDLQKNSIGDNGAQALAEGLETNSTLTTLDLHFNNIRDDGAQALAKVLKINSTLAALGLRENSIWFQGLLAFSEALKTNSTLTTLNLQLNKIGRNGAKALDKAHKTNSTLTTLNLYSNSIGPNGAQAL